MCLLPRLNLHVGIDYSLTGTTEEGGKSVEASIRPFPDTHNADLARGYGAGFASLAKAPRLSQFSLNPVVGNRQTVAKRRQRLPSQNGTKLRIVAITAPYPLRLARVVELAQLLAGNVADQVNQLVNAYHVFRPEIKRLGIVACHQALQALNTVSDIEKGARLRAVSPDLNRTAIFGQSYLAADGGRRLFLAAIVGAERSIDVVKADDARREAIVAESSSCRAAR